MNSRRACCALGVHKKSRVLLVVLLFEFQQGVPECLERWMDMGNLYQHRMTTTQPWNYSHCCSTGKSRIIHREKLRNQIHLQTEPQNLQRIYVKQCKNISNLFYLWITN